MRGMVRRTRADLSQQPGSRLAMLNRLKCKECNGLRPSPVSPAPLEFPRLRTYTQRRESEILTGALNTRGSQLCEPKTVRSCRRRGCRMDGTFPTCARGSCSLCSGENAKPGTVQILRQSFGASILPRGVKREERETGHCESRITGQRRLAVLVFTIVRIRARRVQLLLLGDMSHGWR